VLGEIMPIKKKPQKVWTDAQYEAYMKDVYAKREAWEKKTAEQHANLKKQIENGQRDFLKNCGCTKEEFEAGMSKGSRGKFGLVGTGKIPPMVTHHKKTTKQKTLG